MCADNERRQFSRIYVDRPVTVTLSEVQPFEATMRDISIDGMTIHSETKLPPGSKVSMSFATDDSRQITIRGVMVWAELASSGIQFTACDAASFEGLKELLLGTAEAREALQYQIQRNLDKLSETS